MKEFQDIIQAYDKHQREGGPFALATVINVEGSSYRRIGARMLIFPDGKWLGGISGGCLEGDVLRKAKLALFENEPQTVLYDTSGGHGAGIGAGLGCNGIIEILITPIASTHIRNPIHQIAAALQNRQEKLLLTLTNAGNSGLSLGESWLYQHKEELRSEWENFAFWEDLQAEFQSVQSRQKSKMRRFKGDVQILIEYIPAPIRLMVFGGNYDVVPMLNLARFLGWQTTVVADRDKVFQDVHALADEFFHLEDALPVIDERTAIVLMAHDYYTDKAHLERFRDSDAPYIGILGPRKRTDRMIRELGWDDNPEGKPLPDGLYGPAGMDIGANQPEEIALSIFAEIRAVFAQRNGGFLRNRTSPIHERTKPETIS